MDDYEQLFIDAIARSERFGLHLPENITLGADRFLNESTANELAFVIQNSLGILDEDEIVAQCLMLNMRLKRVFSEYFKVPLYYTIGHIRMHDQDFYKQSEDSLSRMLKEGAKGPSISLHAWLTLPSAEILDFSFSTSYGRMNNLPEWMGRALALHPSDLVNGMTYTPMLVGTNFLYKIGALQFHLEPLDQ